MKSLIQLQSIEIETGITKVRIAINANQSPHPHLALSPEQENENKNAIALLQKTMNNLGFTMKAPKIWTKPNDWSNPNDNIPNCWEWDFSDTFPKEEKLRIEKLINQAIYS